MPKSTAPPNQNKTPAKVPPASANSNTKKHSNVNKPEPTKTVSNSNTAATKAAGSSSSVVKPTALKNPLSQSLAEGLRKVVGQNKVDQVDKASSKPKKTSGESTSVINSLSSSSSSAQTLKSKSNLSTSASNTSSSNVNNSGLSSEPTALEMRLLSTKKLVKLPSSSETTKTTTTTNSITANSASKTITAKPTGVTTADSEKRKNVADQLRKFLKDNEKTSSSHGSTVAVKSESPSKLAIKKEASAPSTGSLNSLASLNAITVAETSSSKRRKSFWEPDSDSEYGKIKKSKSSSLKGLFGVVF